MPAEPATRGTAIVTGARRGIGQAVALQLAREGFAVAVVDVVEDDDAHTTLAALEGLGARAMFVRADVAELEAMEGWLDAVNERLGPPTCLVNNAGMNVPVRGDLLDTTPEVFDRVLDVNLRGTFFLTAAVARRMLAAPTGLHRSIVVISSANAGMVSPEKGAYCLSKAALPMLTGLFAARLGADGIDVHEVQPGLIKTQMNRAVWERYGQAIEQGASLTRRWGTPEDVGAVVAALACGRLPFTTGSAIPVGGGLHVHRL